MGSEPERACGYRKIGGLYLCGSGIGLDCKQLPQIVEVCPCCNSGIKQSRGWTWIVPKLMFPDAQECKCIISECPLKLDTKHGLLWIGEKFYTPESFVAEAHKMGISKRIGAVPRDFQLGKTWVFLAHPAAGFKDNHSVPAVFYAFKPDRIEKIVSETEFQNTEEMNKLKKQGITPVSVPDNDSDHKGSVYDKPVKKQQETLTAYQGTPKIIPTEEA